MPAPTIDELRIADDPAPWAAAGFAVSDGACLVGDVRLRFAGVGAGSGIIDWALRDVASDELDGLPTRLSDGLAPKPAEIHENGVSAIDHIVAISPALDRSVAALRTAGVDLRRVREEPTPAGAPRQAFFRLGAVILEVVQEPDEVIARRGGAERPAHFWGLALLSRDLERTAAAFAPHVSEIRDAVQPGRRIATVKRSAGLAVPVALMSAAREPATRG